MNNPNLSSVGNGSPSFNADPVLRLSVEFGPPLAHLLQPETGDQARNAIATGVAELMESLAIPGVPEIHITPIPTDSDHPHRFLQLRIAGQLCRYPDELLLWVYSFVSSRQLSPYSGLDEVIEWLKTSDDSQAGAPADDRLLFLRLTCQEIVKRQPGLLFGAEQASAYLASLPEPVKEAVRSWPPDADMSLPILKPVLDMWISLADKPVVADKLRAGLIEKRPPEDISEELISALQPDLIEILLHPDYLRQLTEQASDEDLSYPGLIRDEIFYELGLSLPGMRFAPVEWLKPGIIAARINHLVTLPRLGLIPGEVLVDGLPGSLSVDARPALNPSTYQDASVIEALSLSSLPANTNFWGPWDYTLLILNACLREKAVCFISQVQVEDLLFRLKTSYPALVQAVRGKASLAQVTRLLRKLVAEGISIRNLWQILEGLLDYDYILSDPAHLIIFDNRLAIDQPPGPEWINDPTNLASFVRTTLKRNLSFQATHGEASLSVYLLDPQIEQAVTSSFARSRSEGSPWPDEELYSSVIRATRRELGDWPLKIWREAILTSAEVRPLIYELVAQEWPRLRVLAYQELSAEMNIVPLARITL